MREIEMRVRDFYREHGMDPDDIDMESSCRIFLEEMQKGLEGKPSSLVMLPTYIEVDRELPINKRVIVLDAGGTNFRVATVYFTDDYSPVIENLCIYRMPGSDKRVGRDEFFNTIADYVKPVMPLGDRIGFCFSYPTEALPDKDGKLLYMSKELQAEEIEGEIIGKNLLNALYGAGKKAKIPIVLLNDTVATLLAGKAWSRSRIFSNYIGFILGTGSNCCYIEKNQNILKVKGLDHEKSQVINAESGAFSKAMRGDIDRRFDTETVNPGVHTFEKMISGRYIGPLCGMIIRTASDEGFFSERVADRLRRINELSTQEMNEFLCYPEGNDNRLAKLLEPGTGQDRITLYYLIDSLVERVAKFTAIHLASFVIKSGEGKNPCLPVCITAEGAVFYGMHSLKTRVECYIRDYLVRRKGLYSEIIKVDNATLIGAAVAGLTN